MLSSLASRLRLLPAVAASTGVLLTLSVATTGPLNGIGSSAPQPVHPHFTAVRLAPMGAGAVADAADDAVKGGPTEATRPQASARAGVNAPAARAAAPRLRSGALSPVQSTEGRLRVVGVTWPQGRVSKDDRVEYRVRDDGRWSAWTTMAVSESDHAPDPGTAEAKNARGGTDPYVVTGDEVQIRVLSEKDSVAPDVRMDVIDPMTSPADDDAVAVPGAASAAGARPAIYTRKQWGADESIRRGEPSYGTVKAGFVHHTVDANSYSSAQVPAILRGIYSFHVKGRGWSDIGYNFLIDRFGRTWEGRYGGIDKPVVGAHTGGYNSQLFGAAAIGTYTTTTPPTAVLDAYKRLLAWKLGLHHIDPATTVLLDGMSTKVYTVSGHKDADGSVNDTACPGSALYSKLSTLRSGAKSLRGTAFYDPKVSSTSWSYGASGPTLTARPSKSVSWSLQVKSPCRTETLATVTGSATTTSGIKATWNGKLSSGAWAPPGSTTSRSPPRPGPARSTMPSHGRRGCESRPLLPRRRGSAPTASGRGPLRHGGGGSAVGQSDSDCRGAGQRWRRSHGRRPGRCPAGEGTWRRPAADGNQQPAVIGVRRHHSPQGQDRAHRGWHQRHLHGGGNAAAQPRGHDDHPLQRH